MEYVQDDTGRDLRIDFMRGFVMFILIVVHIEIFSWFNFVAWERIGLISGAEGFVILSGFVLGQVHKRVLAKQSYTVSSMKLLERAWQLYKVNVVIVFLIIVISAFALVDLEVIKTFKSWVSEKTYPLFPNLSMPWYQSVTNVLLLKHSPHQIQILGLYTVLLALTPIIVWLFQQNKAVWVCTASVILYFYNWSYPVRPTGSQFEYAFPILSWQILYVAGLSLGFFKEQVQCFFTSARYRALVLISALLTFVFIFLAWHAPNDAFPELVRLNLIPELNFYQLHDQYFNKSKVGLLRLVNYACFLIFFYWCLTKFWQPLNKLFGWLLVPLGQASLYVFIMHLLFVVVLEAMTNFSQVKPDFHSANIWLNTLFHTLALLGLWLMVKKEFLYRYVPR